MKEVFQRVGLKLKTRLCSRRGSPMKFLPISISLRRIEFLNLCSKMEEVEIHQVVNLLVTSVVRSTGVNA